MVRTGSLAHFRLFFFFLNLLLFEIRALRLIKTSRNVWPLTQFFIFSWTFTYGKPSYPMLARALTGSCYMLHDS